MGNLPFVCSTFKMDESRNLTVQPRWKSELEKSRGDGVLLSDDRFPPVVWFRPKKRKVVLFIRFFMSYNAALVCVHTNLRPTALNCTSYIYLPMKTILCMDVISRGCNWTRYVLTNVAETGKKQDKKIDVLYQYRVETLAAEFYLLCNEELLK